MMTDKIKVVNSFTYRKADLHPELDLGKEINDSFTKDMTQLVTMARMMNTDRFELSIIFWGDTDKGLRFSVECDNLIPLTTQSKCVYFGWLRPSAAVESTGLEGLSICRYIP